ncbi:hypothetical protein [Mahella sp.]|nr:hypothetical protein [Mahella sp.]MBZ4666104.1 PglD N-terminal domain [Mahella sp.]
MNDVILIGGGGHAKVIIDALQLMGDYNIYGIIEKTKKQQGASKAPTMS